MAMAIDQFCKHQTGVSPEHFEIIATDISSSALFIANAGRYDRLSIRRGLDENIRDCYFSQDGDTWVLNEHIKSMVTFRKFNLQDSLHAMGRFDIVFLRYAAMYFSEAFKKRLFADIVKVLAPGGYLLLGAVESLRGLCDDCELLMHNGGNYYQARTDLVRYDNG